MAADGVSTHTQRGWRVTTRKLPILKAAPIEAMTDKLGIAPPEMIFGDNFARVEHVASGWAIEFNAFDALDRVDKTGETMLAVAHSRDWQRSRKRHYEDIKEVVKPFDWSYSTDYKGTVCTDSPYPSSSSPLEPSTNGKSADPHTQATTSTRTTSSVSPGFEKARGTLPFALLKQPDPILFFDELLLYEDELADNGTSLFSLKIRVMPERLLLLARFFLRLDDVLFRVRDTRLYVEFSDGTVLREYTAREETFEAVKEKLKPRRSGEVGMADVTAAMRDPNRVADIMLVVDNDFARCVVR